MFLSGIPEVEQMRSQFNPVQAQLIPAHITLCREDEVNDWKALEYRIRQILPFELVLSFGRPIRDENFVYLPVESGIAAFDELRRLLLSNGPDVPRKHMPHMTIVHPRNGACCDATFDEIAKQIQPFTFTFREVHLIEQTNGGPWVTFAHPGPWA